MRTAEFTSSITIPAGFCILYPVNQFPSPWNRDLNGCLGLVKPIRAVAFSPGGKLLAATGDARVISLYDVASGEQVANLTGNGAWVFSLDWSSTGEYLLSG